jgi:predicted transcriptional regulator of viral defense system
MPITLHQQIYEIAEQQFGYITTAQALTAGLRSNAVVLMARRGVLDRVSRGVYRLVSYPSGPLDEYMEAVLWPQGGTQGVISHASALVFHELSDVSPAKMHVTLPRSYRVRRSAPRHLVIHYDPLPPEDVTKVNGIPVTTPMRTIRDAIADHLSPALIRQAIADGRRRAGLRERDEATLLQLMGETPTERRVKNVTRRV